MKILILSLLVVAGICGLAFSYTDFEAPAPVEVPAQRCDSYWLEAMVVTAPSPKQDATLSASFRPYDTTSRMFCMDAPVVTVNIPALFTEAAQDQELAVAMEAVFVALRKYGARQGAFKPLEGQ